MNPSTSHTVEEIREFVIAGHGDFEKVRQMLDQQPGLLGVGYEWGPGDTETAIQAAAHMGRQDIARFLLSRGALLEICTAAMLGQKEDVERLLAEDANRIRASGAHGIPLLTHAALSGQVELMRMLFERGARDGLSMALINAVSAGHVELTRWLLENGKPDVSVKNFQGKTALEIAGENGNPEIEGLLKAHGASAKI
jgi:ankyrin repeat protein